MTSATEGRVTIEEGVVYGTGGGRELRCDVYTPPRAAANAPAVLLVHGGGWRSGDRSEQQVRGYAILFGRAGYVCVAPEMRLSGEAQWPAPLHDLKAAIRWMRANSERLGLNPDQIAVTGESSGGHMALMLAGTRDLPQFEGEGGNAGAGTHIAAVIDMYGITAIEPDGTFLQEALGYLLGADASAERCHEASPLTYASRFPPALLMHSSQDQTVPYTQALTLYSALLAAGTSVEMHMWDREGHTFDRNRMIGRQCAEIMRLFLERYMLGNA